MRRIKISTVNRGQAATGKIETSAKIVYKRLPPVAPALNRMMEQ